MNLSGQPTITDPEGVITVFSQHASTILLQDFDQVPPARRRSATIVDFTQAQPHLVREGSVPADQLAAELRRLGLGELVIGADVLHVCAVGKEGALRPSRLEPPMTNLGRAA